MDKIIIKVPGAPDREVELGVGAHKVGRFVTADLQIEHPSVSGSHCELTVNDGAIAVKDLNSTNGTALDGRLVQECQIVPGQALRLGQVEVLYAPVDASKSSLKLAAPPEIAPPAASEPAVAPHTVRLVPPRKPRVAKNFHRSIPGAFIYPFKRNGILLLIGGTVVFGVFNFLLNFRVFGLQVVGGIVGGIASAMVTGYLFLYMQSILNSTAMGDNGMPNWPEYDGWWDSAISPYLRLLAIVVVCIAPAYVCTRIASGTGALVFFPLAIAGCFYAPMALLAVAIDDSLMGLNPMLVVPSIFRVPVEYIVSCLVFGLMTIVFGALIWLAAYLSRVLAGPPPPFRLPPFSPRYAQPGLFSQLLATFLVLYFGVVTMRLLGLLYYTRQDRLGWRT